MIERYLGKMNLLNKPTLIICYADPTMGVLCSLTIGGDKIDQSRLETHRRLLLTSSTINCLKGSTYPIGSTVYQRSKCLVAKGRKAAVERHHNCIVIGL